MMKKADHSIDHELTCLRILSVVSALSAVISAVAPTACFITRSMLATSRAETCGALRPSRTRSRRERTLFLVVLNT